jgi:hypothetical protein
VQQKKYKANQFLGMLRSIDFLLEYFLRAAPFIMKESGTTLARIWSLPIFQSAGFAEWKAQLLAATPTCGKCHKIVTLDVEASNNY